MGVEKHRPFSFNVQRAGFVSDCPAGMRSVKMWVIKLFNNDYTRALATGCSCIEIYWSGEK